MKRSLSFLCLIALACGDDDPRRDSPAPLPDGSTMADGGPADGFIDSSFNIDGTVAMPDSSRGDAAPAEGGSGSLVFQPSPELNSLLERFSRLRRGEPVDLDGDGRAESSLTMNSDGTRAFSSDQDGEGTPEFVLTVRPDGTSLLLDKNRDGMSDEETTVTSSDTTQRRVSQVDEDLDGRPDHRYTWVVERATLARQQYTAEEDLSESGTYTPVSSLTLMTTKDQSGDDCEGSDGFPSDGDEVQPFPGSPTVITGSSPGACSGADASSIAQAVDCALTKGALCLANTNTRQYNSLMAAAFGQGTMPLDIGCGNSCAGKLAATRGWSAPWFTNSTLNINPTEWNKLDSAGKCNIMLHELLHWAGDQGSADHNSRSGKGDDEVYSCGRYCGGCSNAGHGSPSNSAIDCAKCADTPERKAKCGAKSEFKTGSCNGELAGLCHAGLACVSANCETCGQIEKKSCDDKPLDTEITCCATCPSNCNRSNDQPCNGAPQLMDTCNGQTPPFCKR
jgi:hypothetical protein